eukprot:gnl/TRDRNA2_/TRDRNA2_177839_c14_seq25.p1 gnl/TRDRNA2_/TRDRNA2_177839_c14~~gnl/TRDRNA2_/TRDRNA2_177839_c14_seq25.p1  ORF type:complete len:388 (-),score=119.73 gnl/TRDRNA2_/TRDRNA2_177839_c14_seq25:38-1201(-)
MRAQFVILFLALASVGAVGTSERAMVSANPIRKIVTLLQNMQKKVEEEGKKEEELFDKFMCYCKGGKGTLASSIEAAKTKISDLKSSIDTSSGEKAQTEVDLRSHRADRDAAKSAMDQATGVRAKEAKEYASASADLKTNIAAMGKEAAAGLAAAKAEAENLAKADKSASGSFSAASLEEAHAEVKKKHGISTPGHGFMGFEKHAEIKKKQGASTPAAQRKAAQEIHGASMSASRRAAQEAAAGLTAAKVAAENLAKVIAKKNAEAFAVEKASVQKRPVFQDLATEAEAAAAEQAPIDQAKASQEINRGTEEDTKIIDQMNEAADRIEATEAALEAAVRSTDSKAAAGPADASTAVATVLDAIKSKKVERPTRSRRIVHEELVPPSR